MFFAFPRVTMALLRHSILIAKMAFLWLLIAAQAQAGISVYVDPGTYTGDWSQADGGAPVGFAPGARTIEVNEGFNFMFVGGIGGFQFNVAPDGTVTTGPVPATGGVGTLTFNTVEIAIDPVDFTGQWIISRVTGGLTGPQSVVLVPGMPYAAFVGGGNSARFNFQPAGDGEVSIIANTDAADGGDHSVTFNTAEVFVDPGTYTGSWQIPGINAQVPIVQAIGPASAILVVGVSYGLIPDRMGMSFPVTEPCGVTELDFVDFVFTIGCSPVAYSCDGFLPPMDKVVTVRNHRALPLKGVLTDGTGFTVANFDIAASPVLEVLFSASLADDPVDVTDEALPVGESSAGNSFVYDPSTERWRFNLSTENYSAIGTYRISLKSGDITEYAVDPACEASFVIE